jgi:hypothetical protein
MPPPLMVQYLRQKPLKLLKHRADNLATLKSLETIQAFNQRRLT